MRRTFAYLLICLPLCLLLVPNSVPVALSISGSSEKLYCDDGGSLPSDEVFARLACENPVEMLRQSLKKYDREIKGYCGLMKKHERIKGKEQSSELIDFCFREEPYSVLMKWRQGARGAKASLYVCGQNNNKVAVVTNTKLAVTWDIDPEGRFAADAGRYSIREFSLRQGTERMLRAWQAAKDRGALTVEYLGKLPVVELDGRVCYILKRTCNPPEDDGIAAVEVAIDAENWLQLGSTLTDVHGQLVGQYQICALKINPEYDVKQFERSALKK
jgi:hypothetical protein